MLRILVIVILLVYYQIESKENKLIVIEIEFFYFIKGVTIEYPSSVHIVERIREDIDSIDQIFRYYIVPREIQFHADALEGGLSFFLQCKGSHSSIKFTVPTAATDVSY
jgi:hypothetical protein